MATRPRPWQPLSREQFGELQRHQVLQKRRGRLWTVYVAPFQKDGLAHVVLVSGAQVRHVPERFCDDYMLLQGSPHPGDPSPLPGRRISLDER
jgi:hypothetical protein